MQPRKKSPGRHTAANSIILLPDYLVTVNDTIIVPFTPPPGSTGWGASWRGITRADLVEQIEASRRKNPDADGRRIQVKKGENYLIVRSDGKGFLVRIGQVVKDGVGISAMYLGHLRMKAAEEKQVSVSDPSAKPTGNTSQPKKPRRKYPRILATSPAVGVTDVDPATDEITVTFDRDMGEGFSWTGGGPNFPTIPEGKKPIWRNSRICTLPVKLEPGRFYRVGVQAGSFRNFRSAEGVPARPSVIYFTTKGASDEVKKMLSIPKIVSIIPPNGAKDADPSLAEIRVTFDIPMAKGMSWTGGGDAFPKSPEGKKAYWTKDGKTCMLPVALGPGREYRIGLNGLSFNNFQSEPGVPLEPVVYTFRTRGE